jgi:hypothetical protein
MSFPVAQRLRARFRRPGHDDRVQEQSSFVTELALYTIIFGQRSHHISDEAAKTVEAAIASGDRLVTISIELGGDDSPPFEVLLNTANIVGLIRHQPERPAKDVPENVEPFRPYLVPV